jgi:hypothetical protein
MSCRPFASCFRCLAPLLIAAIGSKAVGQNPPPAAEPNASESPLSAPFVARSFVESIIEELEHQKIEDERVNGVYLDPGTGLLWATEDNGRDIAWRRAATYCEDLVLADFDDWYLPTLEELESLLRPMAQGAYNLPVKIKLTACCPWSSTAKNDQSAWNFNFQFSKPFSGAYSYTYDHRALCMRRPSEEERSLIEELQKAARKK